MGRAGPVTHMPVPKRHWRTHGNNYQLPTDAEALNGRSAARAHPAPTHQRPVNLVTVVIWGGRLLGAAGMMALLFLWAAGWLPLQASAPEAKGGRARGAGDRPSADLADTDRRRPSMTSQTAASSPANADNPTEPAPAAKSAIVTTQRNVIDILRQSRSTDASLGNAVQATAAQLG